MGGASIPPIPDWKIYKVGDHTPELQKLEAKLAARGLKDPWIRNEVWRYDVRNYKTTAQRTIGLMTKGMPLGFALAVITSAYTFWSNRNSGHH